MPPTRFVQFVVKISKLCNLRCRYCYEFPHLGNKAAMSREQLQAMYGHIRDHYAALDAADGETTEVRFIWHGGEPLLIPPSFYWQTFSDQDQVFGSTLGHLNILQTNLTRLDDGRLELIRSGFHRVGVSVDLFSGLRVDVGGRDSQNRVLRNMQRLRDEGIDFGAITVLTRRNLPHVEKIYEFFKRAGIQFRVLPLFDGAFDDQHESYDLSTEDVLDAYRTLIDRYIADDCAVGVNPIVEHVQAVLGHLLANDTPRFYSRRGWIPTIMVNTDGECYGYGDPYGIPEWTFGNIFRSPLSALFSSQAFERSIEETEKRMARNCVTCPYFGSCDGYPIAEDLTNCRERDESGIRICVLERGAMAHIETVLRERGYVDREGRFKVDAEVARRFGMRIGADAAASRGRSDPRCSSDAAGTTIETVMDDSGISLPPPDAGFSVAPSLTPSAVVALRQSEAAACDSSTG